MIPEYTTRRTYSIEAPTLEEAIEQAKSNLRTSLEDEGYVVQHVKVLDAELTPRPQGTTMRSWLVGKMRSLSRHANSDG